MTVYKPTPLSEADEAVAQQVMATLNETEAQPVEQIRRMVAVLGADAVQAILQKTHEVEAAGGLYYGRKHDLKRRTIGGAFFYTARGIVDKVLWSEKIHVPWEQQPQKRKKKVRVPPYRWEARLEDVKAFEGSKDRGEASVEIKLIGTPAKVLDKGSVMLLVMTGKVPTALPRGLPQLPEGYQPVYLAMVAKKQWEKVADKIAAGERLLLTGFPIYDEKLKRITVLVKSTQTIPAKKLKEKTADDKPADS